MTVHNYRFREIANELRLTAQSVGEVAFATLLEASIASQQRANLEVLGLRLGLSAQAVHAIVDGAQRRADLLADAHKLITALIPLERAIAPATSSEE